MIRSFVGRHLFSSFVVVWTALTLGYHAWISSASMVDDWAYPTAVMGETTVHIDLWWLIVGCYVLWSTRSVWVVVFGHLLDLVVWLAWPFPWGLRHGVFYLGVFVAFLTTMSPMVCNYTIQNPERMGWCVGGAKDISTFRRNIAANLVPQPESINCEGLFNEYCFDTGLNGTATHLFEPSYTCARARNPVTGNTEYYMAVGLNSSLTASTYRRRPLNLVIVLDISGSMDDYFNSYYYDEAGQPLPSEPTHPDATKTKIEVARRAIADMLDHLKPGDRFGMVLFDNNAVVAKPMRDVGLTDMAAIRQHILDINTGGCTNFEAGMRAGIDLMNSGPAPANGEREQRIIYLTDAMPNQGVVTEDGLVAIARQAATQRIYTTFIGIGLDFNSELVEGITQVRGANYCAVHSCREFKKRLDEDFDFLVNPLVFDLCLRFKSDGYRISQVYGSPEANAATGEIMKVNTLFPAPSRHEEIRGGVILLKIERLQEANPRARLEVSYQTCDGTKREHETTIRLTDLDRDGFANPGIRKAVLLARYVDLMKQWCVTERRTWTEQMGRAGAVPTWEQKSVPFKVQRDLQRHITRFAEHFTSEMKVIGDPTLAREEKLLGHLSSWQVSQLPAPRVANGWE